MKFSKNEIIQLVKNRSAEIEVKGLKESYSYCRAIAKQHYENFPVGSFLVPKQDRPHFYSVYAFSRLGDDIGDEHDFTSEERIELLNGLKNMLLYFINNEETIGNPIGIALANTCKEKGIPSDILFLLLEAFERDSNLFLPETLDDLIDYCNYSANPVGELVLYISGEHNQETKKFSDYFCTGLQLINFWQDLSRDIPNSRCYIPKEVYSRYEFEIEEIRNRKFKGREEEAGEMIDSLLSYTREIMERGRQITKYVKSRRLRTELLAMFFAAETVLQMCEKLGLRLFFERPAIKKSTYLGLIPKLSVSLLRKG